MGLSRKFKEKLQSLNQEDFDRIIRMCWEDRSTFESIELQFGFSENELVKLMRTKLSSAAFSRWRKRVHLQGQLKHETKRGFKVTRFKCSRQSVDGITKGWK